MTYTLTFKDGKSINIPDKESAIKLFQADMVTMIVVHGESTPYTFKTAEEEQKYSKAWDYFLESSKAKLKCLKKVVKNKKNWKLK